MSSSHKHNWFVLRWRWRQIGLITLASILVALFYPFINKEFSNPSAFINAICIGLFGGLAIGIREDYRFYQKLKRENFLRSWLISAILYTIFFALIIATVMGVSYGIQSETGIIDYVTGPEYRKFIFQGDYFIILMYALFFCGVVSFSLIISRKVESTMILNILTGRYRVPLEEHRIFMSIDLNNSTGIAEQLSEEQYFSFLNKFYFDLTPAIIAVNGEIYRYVGDQIQISWSVGSHEKNLNALLTFFQANDDIKSSRQEYIAKYGVYPSFKAVLHSGMVVAGEIGVVKSQFVFHGEVLQALADMEKLCKPCGVNLLLSDDYVNIIDLPGKYQLTPCIPENETAPFSLFTINQ